jgi:hypothetical protein
VLLEFGLPDGAVRPVPAGPFDGDRVRAAVRDVTRDLDARRVAPLLAWLRAWQQHWGTSFRSTLGERGAAIIDDLRSRLDDENRYLKLRRIAIENLAGLL